MLAKVVLLGCLASASAFSVAPSLAPGLRPSAISRASAALPVSGGRMGLRTATKTTMLGNLFGGGGGGGPSGGEVVSKVYLDIEIGGKSAGEPSSLGEFASTHQPPPRVREGVCRRGCGGRIPCTYEAMRPTQTCRHSGELEHIQCVAPLCPLAVLARVTRPVIG